MTNKETNAKTATINEDWIRKYLSKCTKETLIELYLQMRFERDLYMKLCEIIREGEKE